jgi:hypothetical protein
MFIVKKKEKENTIYCCFKTMVNEHSKVIKTYITYTTKPVDNQKIFDFDDGVFEYSADKIKKNSS